MIARQSRTRTRQRHPAFTLVELLVVMAIIGILITFLLIAAQDGVRRAQEKATLSLIVKLETGLSERMEAILLRRADVTQAHLDLSSVWSTGGQIFSGQRAQVIAQFDLVRAELPDGFFVQTQNGGTLGASYPLNFAGIDYPLGSGNYNIPLGSTTGSTIGVFGATYQAAAGIYKNLGYLPQGYDGVDNNSNGLIDDSSEGVGTDPIDTTTGLKTSVLINQRLAAHTHNTARSEMLYALLVEGIGPLGNVFSRDDFTKSEVGDTDGDNLPEFIDAWGKPLQFYRWPIYYNGNGVTNDSTSVYIQKGMNPYRFIYEPRQTDTLDGNQMLVAPSWFSAAANTSPPAAYSSYLVGGPGCSATAAAFCWYFHSLLEPNFGSSTDWDRSSWLPRRAYYSRPLIISSGPDLELGVGQLNLNYSNLYSVSDGSGTLVPISTGSASSGSTINNDASRLIRIENQAGAIDPNRTNNLQQLDINHGTNQTTIGIVNSGLDDISNQSLSAPGGGVR